MVLSDLVDVIQVLILICGINSEYLLRNYLSSGGGDIWHSGQRLRRRVGSAQLDNVRGMR